MGRLRWLGVGGDGVRGGREEGGVGRRRGVVDHPAEHAEHDGTDASSTEEQSRAESREGRCKGDQGGGAADWPDGGEGGSGHGGMQTGQPARLELLGVHGWREWGNVDVEVVLCVSGCQR